VSENIRKGFTDNDDCLEHQGEMGETDSAGAPLLGVPMLAQVEYCVAQVGSGVVGDRGRDFFAQEFVAYLV
jgi:hypothetical protein